MTRVLLIADTERVQRIFLSLQEKGLLQLQTVSTLDDGESELLAGQYDVTFVQSRISGFSGVILLRHLDKVLPKGGRLILLGGDPDDTAHARKHGRDSIDLALDDVLLEQTVLALVTGAPIPESEKAEKAEAPAKTVAAQTRTAQRSPAAKAVRDTKDDGKAPAADQAEELQQEEPPAPAYEPAPAPEPEHEPGSEPEPGEVQVRKWEPAPFEEPVPPAEPPPQPREDDGESNPPSFEEAMERAAAGITIDPTALQIEDRVNVRGKGTTGGEAPVKEPGQGGGFRAGEPLADAIRRAEKKKSRRYPVLIPALILILAVPLISFFVGRNERDGAELSDVSPPPAPKSAQQAPILSAPPGPPSQETASATPGGLLPAQPVQQPPAAAPGVGQGAAPAVPPAAKPAPRGGLEQLPPMLEGTRLDPEYGKSRPGWVRYIGLRAEYNLFREDNLYRAVQVVARAGGNISDDLFRRMLKEFGGIENYRVESTGSKGDYLVEQCSTNGNTALTIYRSKDSRKMKGFVIYYR